jgi:pimeloyl-ACP methyl ester carboxylesterase
MLECLAKSGSPSVYKILFAKGYDFDDIISEVTHPVDLLWGEKDKLVSHKDVARLRTLVNLERVHMLPGIGHWPTMESPDAVVDFIAATPRP